MNWQIPVFESKYWPVGHVFSVATELYNPLQQIYVWGYISLRAFGSIKHVGKNWPWQRVLIQTAFKAQSCIVGLKMYRRGHVLLVWT